MPVSQYEIYIDTSTYIIWNLIAESRTHYQKFLQPHSGKFPAWNLCETQMLLEIEVEVLHLCSLSNLCTPFTYATLVFLSKLEINGHGRSKYLLSFSSRRQEIKIT